MQWYGLDLQTCLSSLVYLMPICHFCCGIVGTILILVRFYCYEGLDSPNSHANTLLLFETEVWSCHIIQLDYAVDPKEGKLPTIQFKGKSFVQNHHLSVPYHQLVPNQSQSLTDKVSLQDNLIIHGDNLLALKALLPTYAGKIKCIYIDPPYNTGNEGWVYNDRVNSPFINEWIGKVVGKEGEDFTRHDKWLCMMMPRLKLLRELLADDGVIFVSIDRCRRDCETSG